jgi:predicted RNA binding protein YcfA (HicA-like mRNA interferase family)
MKALSGREFARLIERRGWQLLRVAGSHHIYGKTGSVVRLQFRSTATGHSRSGCCVIWPSLPKFPMRTCNE